MTPGKHIYRLGLRDNDLVYFQAGYKETDLYVGLRKDRFSAAIAARVGTLIRTLRDELDAHIKSDPAFLHALEPYVPAPPAPATAREMAAAARKAGVGPMAAVAGVFADRVGRMLTRFSKEVIVENGGDIFLRSSRRRRIGIFAGDSPFTGRLAVEIPAHLTPLGVCTSSGVVGHAYSRGKADAVVILADSAALADAAATATANRIKATKHLERATDFAMAVDGVMGVLAIKGEHMAARGKIKLVPVTTTDDGVPD